MHLGLKAQLLLLFCGVNFFLHFAWEMLQIPFYKGMTDANHGAAVWLCTKATAGDVVIALVAYLVGACAARSLCWLYPLSLKPLLFYYALGLGITVVFEDLATGVLDRWAYSELMPTIPLSQTGLLPILQWLIIPAVALASVRLMYFGLLFKAQSST